MIFEHENSFAKQVILYLKHKQYKQAHDLAEAFVKHYPKSLIAYYLLAKSCYRLEDFNGALTAGHKAFNLSESNDDLVGTGVFLACVYYELRRYTKGYEVLRFLSDIGDERVEKALFIFALIMNKPEEALLHVDTLYMINKSVATEFVDKFLSLAEKIESPAT